MLIYRIWTCLVELSEVLCEYWSVHNSIMWLQCRHWIGWTTHDSKCIHTLGVLERESPPSLTPSLSPSPSPHCRPYTISLLGLPHWQQSKSRCVAIWLLHRNTGWHGNMSSQSDATLWNLNEKWKCCWWSVNHSSHPPQVMPRISFPSGGQGREGVSCGDQ